MNTESDKRDRVLKAAFACQPRLVAYAHGILRDYASAEDVVENAFLVVVDKYDAFEEGSSILAWTRAIVRLQVLRHLRNRKREILVVEDPILNDAVEAAFSWYQSDIDAVHFDNLKDCPSKLRERDRRVLALRFTDKLGYHEIGSALDMKIEAVRKSLFRIKERSCAAACSLSHKRRRDERATE
jgi:RNA polymerase sigma-70 factor (ECF subfamily)